MAVEAISDLYARGVVIMSLTEPGIDTTTPMGRVLFGMVALFAQLRVNTIRDNTRRDCSMRAKAAKSLAVRAF